MAANAPRKPEMKVTESAMATHNDPALVERVARAMGAAIGDANLTKPPMKMGAEDFSEYGSETIPTVLLWVGAVEPQKYAASLKGELKLPSLHSPFFAPDVTPTLKTAILAETVATLELLRPQ